jgi:hypothetical protein
MNNLQQQLQAWADRGAFKFPNGDDIVSVARCFTMIKEDSNDNRVGMFSLTPEQNFGIQCVLDGTIQVWRPVEHYKPKDNENVLLYDPTHTDEYGEPLTTVIGYYREEDGEFHRFEIYRNGMTLMSPTHYQPLPNHRRG